MRWTTHPVARRGHPPESGDRHPGGDVTEITDLVTGHEDDQSSEEPRENTLCTTHIIRSTDSIRTQGDHYISILDAYEIAFEIAAEHAFGAAVCPEDSPSGWKEAMSR